jgi:sugar (pentulose or hexulose) kinase
MAGMSVFRNHAGSGQMLDWVKSLLKIKSNQHLNKLAAQAPPGSGGLVFLPTTWMMGRSADL